MIRSPPAADKNAKSGFRLEPATLKLGASDTPATGELPSGSPDPAEVDNVDDADADLDLEGSAYDLLGDTATSVGGGLDAEQEKPEDTFDRLTRMMCRVNWVFYKTMYLV